MILKGNKLKNSSRFGKGIYLLPNLFTTAGFFAGFFAIVSAMNSRFEAAAVAIFVAMIMDGIDGRVARMTNTQSAFGAEYDSMADLVSFGVAPALMVYVWALKDLGNLGWLASFVFAVSAALRLARFNTQVATADKRYFQGLASPSAAAVIAGMIWTATEYDISPGPWNIVIAGITVATGILMVSNFRYSSFKELNWKGRVPFITLLLFVVVFVLVAYDPPIVLFGAFVLYALSGPFLTVKELSNVRRRRYQGQSNADSQNREESADSEVSPKTPKEKEKDEAQVN